MTDGKRVCAVHLDLKGLPPTAERLVELVRVFAAAGYNAVLVEWEDMFPWNVDRRFRCETAYTPEEVGRFYAEAQRVGLEIIPLVQCLGHLETPLRLPEYAHLREVGHQSDVLNPLASGGRELIERMIDDVLALSPSLRYFHLGGDEAWSFGTHAQTKAYIEKHGKGALYLRHVEPLLERLNARGIRPILWHDMMIHWEGPALDRISPQADLCVWGYWGTHEQAQGHWQIKYIELFKKHGIQMWGATAYKGADSPSADLPNPVARQINCQAWAQVAQRYGMAGVVATAWSRYSTHLMQTSPIDAALDLLVLCGRILRDGDAPAGGMAGCLEALETMGERERFEGCYAAMKRLAKSRSDFWRHLQLMREAIATAEADERRRGSEILVKYYLQLRDQLRRAQEAADLSRRAFERLVPAVWIERYLVERVGPMREEMALVTPRIERLDPTGYAAAVAGLSQKV